MRIDLIKDGNTYYKANLHAHTILSDGGLTPEQLKELYKSRGYSILAYTDHDLYHDHSALCDEDFLAISGCEIGFQGVSPYDGRKIVCHLCGLAARKEALGQEKRFDVLDFEKETVNRRTEELKSAGFITVFSHPGWSGVSVTDIEDLDGIIAFEVYNHGTQVITNSGWGHLYYDALLKSGRKLFAIACDDSHCRARKLYGCDEPTHIVDAFGGFTMIRAGTLTLDVVMQSIQAGDFYCSTGPLIHAVWIENQTLVVDCDPVCSIFAKTNIGGHYANRLSDRDNITHAEFDLAKCLDNGHSYIRLELLRKDGTMAFTNPFYFRDAFPR